MVTGMKRSDSLLQPDLFRYHNHFEFLAPLGRTHLSEVRAYPGRPGEGKDFAQAPKCEQPVGRGCWLRLWQRSILQDRWVLGAGLSDPT
jgi:hypothetical protein